MSAAPLAELQNAGTAYPQWVRDRFLQLPDEFPSSVRKLAESVTANHDTPLDKAIAVENFLRGYKYNQQIDAPPPDVDAVEHFLFTTKEGYCDYYASAMVTMLRSVGVPARFVVGYTPGDYIQPAGRIDAHDDGNRDLSRAGAQRPCLARGLLPEIWVDSVRADSLRTAAGAAGRADHHTHSDRTPRRTIRKPE